MSIFTAARASSASLVSVILLAAFVCTVCPLLFWLALTHGASGGNAQLLFRLHAICSTGAVLSTVGIVARRSRSRNDLSIAWTCAFTALVLLAMINSSCVRSSWDYAQIELASLDIVRGIPLYHSGTTYVLYPPFYASCMSFVFAALSKTLELLHLAATPDKVLDLIFYLFENLQLYASWTLVYLSCRFLLNTRHCSRGVAVLLSCSVVLLSAAISGTIKMHQVNILICCSILFGFLYSSRWSLWSGLAVALGAHLKVYPLVDILPWISSKQWRTCVWTAIFLAAIACVVSLQLGWSIFPAYFQESSNYLKTLIVSRPDYLFHSPTYFSALYAISSLFGVHGLSVDALNASARVLSAITIFWFAWRISQRHRMCGVRTVLVGQYDDLSDLLSIALLAGPTVLPHHYVLAIPIILWSIVRSVKIKPLMTCAGVFSVLWCPCSPDLLTLMAPCGIILLALARQFDLPEADDSIIPIQQRDLAVAQSALR